MSIQEQSSPQPGGVMPNPSVPAITPPVRPVEVSPTGVVPTKKAPNGVAAPKKMIRAFDQTSGPLGAASTWKRQPLVCNTGACHVKTFHAKLTGDSMTYLDNQINEWLDEHPDYEVKLVTTTIGEWSGKLGSEPHMICQVWV